MESALSALNYLPSNEREIQHFVEKAKDEILSGIRPPLSFLYQKKMIERTLAAIFDDKAIQDYMEAEVALHGRHGAKMNGYKFENCERTSYDYSSNGSWRNLTEKRKEIEELMKRLKSPIADLENGEMIEPAVKKTTSYIKMTKIS